jgi:hypothetical protein
MSQITKIRFAIALLFVAWAFTSAKMMYAAEIVLADRGQSAYRIVLADDASPSTRYGAEELQLFLEKITGVKLPIVSDRQPQQPNEIILGDNAHLRKLALPMDYPALGRDGYVIRTIGQSLVIAGGPLRGSLFGVYGFLEDHLGCRWFTPDVSRIPKHTRLAITAIDDCQTPPLEYREPFLYECFDHQWRARNRIPAGHEGKRGGTKIFAEGFFVHTFRKVIPPQKYFKDHPEYFSLVGGKRLSDNEQLCCTNPDVVRIFTEAVREAMRTQPQAWLFSVSQNDWHNYCECPNCQKVANQEGSNSGPILQLVNRVAESVEKEFPDKCVETLAYLGARRPPKHMRPRPNVIIRLCSIECCFAHPLATCDHPLNKLFREDLEGWSKVAGRLWVWDYAGNYSHTLAPFPNLRVLGPNIRYYAAHNVKGIFEEGIDTTPHSSLAALGGYIMTKCLWNPNYDSDKAMAEFLDAYYEKAAGAVRGYIDLLHDRVERENLHVNCYPGIDAVYLSDDLLLKANDLWQQAEDLTARQPEVLRRVKLSRMSVDYAILERARLQIPMTMNRVFPTNPAIAALAQTRFKPFREVFLGSNLNRLKLEAPVNKEAYCLDLEKVLSIHP